MPISNELPSSWCSPEIGLHLLLRAHIKHEETEGAPEDFEEVYYEESDLSGGVEGVDYTIVYGVGEGHKEEADN
jgi:hypothetical protein